MGVLRRLLAIPVAETHFDRRGFAPGETHKQDRLETIGARFVAGFNAALDTPDAVRLGSALESVPCVDRGFAHEGAGMALALLDTLMPPAVRLNRFLADIAYPHRYLVNVGAGWILGRIPLPPASLRARLDPLLGWLTLDGYGFHEAYFHPERTVNQQRQPRKLAGYEMCVFDQGVGRALWFVCCADVDRIAATIGSFPRNRRADLWSGIGLACTYAGGAELGELKSLMEYAAPYAAEFAQGSAFAVKARFAGGNVTDVQEQVVPLLCGVSAEEAAAATDRALAGLKDEDGLPAYAHWRRRIQNDLRGRK